MNIRFVWATFIASLMLFLYFEYYLISLNIPTFIFYIISLSISTSLIFIFILSRKIETVIFALIIYHLFLKVSFLSLFPKSIITPYLDTYVIYQISSQIISNGNLLMNPELYTLGAQTSVNQPIWPTFSVMLSEITGVSIFQILRHLGILFAPLIPISFYLYYYALKYQNSETLKLSLLLISSSPWLIFFLTWGHYSNSSLIFVSILSYLLLEKRIRNFQKITLYTITATALTFTHFYMNVVFLIILLLYLFLLLFINRDIFSQFAKFGVLHLIIFLYYLLWFALAYLDRSLFFIQYLTEAIDIGSPNKGFEFYFTGGTFQMPIYVTILRYGGVIAWGILLLFSLYFLFKGYFSIKQLIFYILFGIVGLILAIPYIFDPKYGTDLFNRSLYLFVLLSAAPLSALGYVIFKKITLYSKVFTVLLLVLIVNFGLIMVPSDFQSWNYPIRGGEDVRLNQSEWSSVGFFASAYIEKISSVCGLRQGVGKIGYFASLNYYELQPSASNQIPILKPEEWEKLPDLWTEYCFVRKSITSYPEVKGYLVDKDDFQKVYLNTNVIYSTTDVIGMKLRG